MKLLFKTTNPEALNADIIRKIEDEVDKTHQTDPFSPIENVPLCQRKVIPFGQSKLSPFRPSKLIP